MAWKDRSIRLGLGIFFIFINSLFFFASVLQVIRSAALFLAFDDNKVYLTVRIFNFITTSLLVTFAFIDTDFWIYENDVETISDGIYYFNITLKGCIDISICITGSMLILELIRHYFEVELNNQRVPNVINYFWFGVGSSFSFIVFLSLLVAFTISEWIFIRIYADIRLLYLFVAACNLSYTYYWVFYKADETVKKHLRIAVLFLLFAIAALIGSIYFFVETFLFKSWTLYNVVYAGLNDADDLSSYVESFAVLLIGWGGYWFIMLWYIKIAWISSGEIMLRKTHEAIEDAAAPEHNML